jgi:hypothetical protein
VVVTAVTAVAAGCGGGGEGEAAAPADTRVDFRDADGSEGTAAAPGSTGMPGGLPEIECLLDADEVGAVLGGGVTFAGFTYGGHSSEGYSVGWEGCTYLPDGAEEGTEVTIGELVNPDRPVATDFEDVLAAARGDGTPPTTDLFGDGPPQLVDGLGDAAVADGEHVFAQAGERIVVAVYEVPDPDGGPSVAGPAPDIEALAAATVAAVR